MSSESTKSVARHNIVPSSASACGLVPHIALVLLATKTSSDTNDRVAACVSGVNPWAVEAPVHDPIGFVAEHERQRTRVA